MRLFCINYIIYIYVCTYACVFVWNWEAKYYSICLHCEKFHFGFNILFQQIYQINCIAKADSKALTNAHRGQIMPHIWLHMCMCLGVCLYICVLGMCPIVLVDKCMCLLCVFTFPRSLIRWQAARVMSRNGLCNTHSHTSYAYIAMHN